jgi:uncharacterized membrane protein YoaK (UPF0700 family)
MVPPAHPVANQRSAGRVNGMKAAERDTLLFILAVTSGSADGWSYMGLGHAFVANMTGNTVLLGIAIFGERRDIFAPLISLACYAAGVATGSFLTRKVKDGSFWPRSVSRILFLEAAVMIFCAIAWMRMGAMPTALSKKLLLAGVAYAIGLQSGAMLPLKLPGIITTYITGTWTTLVGGLILLSTGRPRHHGNYADYENRLIVQVVFLAVYFFSAVAAGWIFRRAPILTGSLSAIPILIVAAYSALRA